MLAFEPNANCMYKKKERKEKRKEEQGIQIGESTWDYFPCVSWVIHPTLPHTKHARRERERERERELELGELTQSQRKAIIKA